MNVSPLRSLRKLTTFTTAVALLVLALPAFALDLTREERDFIAEHPTIVVGGEMDWPPMDYVEDGIYKGAAADSQAAISGELPETRFTLGLE